MTKLTPQMEKLLGLMEPGKRYTTVSIQQAFYGEAPGSFGYAHVGRGRGTGAMLSTFKALERRGLVEREGMGGWKLVEQS